jgi:hypothetical protein
MTNTRLVQPSQILRRLGIKESQFYYWVRLGLIQKVPSGKKNRFLYNVEDVEKIISKIEVAKKRFQDLGINGTRIFGEKFPSKNHYVIIPDLDLHEDYITAKKFQEEYFLSLSLIHKWAEQGLVTRYLHPPTSARIYFFSRLEIEKIYFSKFGQKNAKSR